jgi:Rps23 Pro-64 3,4-dihydroxylase Tpa1-like proline 4-hydroxylase
MKTGNYIAPHSDRSHDEENWRVYVLWSELEGAFLVHAPDSSSLAFVLQLSRGWQDTWGGDFFWCYPQLTLSQEFNRLVLFPVSFFSCHMVTPVHPQVCCLQSTGPHAHSQSLSSVGQANPTTRRLAFTGWFTTVDEDSIEKQETASDHRPSNPAAAILVDVRGCTENPHRECVAEFGLK